MVYVTYIFSFAMNILGVVASWIVFKKAGEAGWKCLIPFLAEYTNFKIIGKKGLAIPYIISEIGLIISSSIVMVQSVLAMKSTDFESAGLAALGIAGLVMIVLLIVMFVLSVIYALNLAKVFGQSTLFGVGILFLGNIFKLILAFSSNIEYVGFDGDEDYIEE